MPNVVYEVVEHDGGWAYRAGETFSETFPSHDEARIAATKAAAHHQYQGSSSPIEYQNGKGEWRVEQAGGDDRPRTTVKDSKSE